MCITRKSGILCLSLVCLLIGTSVSLAASWRDTSQQAVLKNKTIEAKFQGGLLYELKDRKTGQTLLSVSPADMPAKLQIFGTSGIDLDTCTVSQKVTKKSVISIFRGANGVRWQLRWSIEPGTGDLILRMSAKTPEPVTMLRYIFTGCDIADHSMVMISGYGVGQVYNAPWKGTFGDPAAKDYSQSYNHPLVALFQGETSGWFLEGRDLNLGPANAFSKGLGQTADIAMIRGYPSATREPEMFEMRLRTYSKHWEDAVDPYIDWMEKDAGFAPLGTGHHPVWVKDIKNQAYVRVGNFERLEALAKRVDPAKTFIGREVGWRKCPMDRNFPNYEITDVAARWFRRARDLGFHVGAHFNSKCITLDYPELIERFRPGLQVTGTDDDGNEIFDGVGPQHAGRLVYCSAAYKPFRDYLIKQMRYAVDAGVDVIYLDQSMAPGGKFLIDGVNGIQGLILLIKETMEAYPGVAVELEQFNPMSARYASFTLSQMPLGHPLSGYIFHKFINIVPEGIQNSPIDTANVDAFQVFGFMLPSANEYSWLNYSRAFQQYDLVPDSRLPRKAYRKFETHPSHGWTPVSDSQIPAQGYKMFGYRGAGGVTAYFEKCPNKRGLVIYEPGKEPRWIGTRISGVRTWQGPGVLRELVQGVNAEVDWLIYDGNTMLGLDPKMTYRLDESAVLPQDRFHVTSIPEDFAGFYGEDMRTIPQDVARDESYYRVVFTGNGEIKMYVPDDVLVFLNGEQVTVDRQAKTAQAQIVAQSDKPGLLLAYRKTETQLTGRWVNLPWQTSANQREWYVSRHIMYGFPADGPALLKYDGNGFNNHVAGIGTIIGRIPNAKSIRLQGAFCMGDDSTGSYGDGVVRLNGKEVLRIPVDPPSTEPYKIREFNVDISSFAGKYVMLEFTCDGIVRGSGSADWYNPQIVVEH